MNLGELYDYLTKKCGYYITITYDDDRDSDSVLMRLVSARQWESDDRGIALRIMSIKPREKDLRVETHNAGPQWVKNDGGKYHIKKMPAQVLSRVEFIEYARLLFPQAGNVFTPLAEFEASVDDSSTNKDSGADDNRSSNRSDNSSSDNSDNSSSSNGYVNGQTINDYKNSRAVLKLTPTGVLHVYLNGLLPTATDLLRIDELAKSHVVKLHA